MSEKFWKNKNILITGYEGFLGSHLTKKLLELKANIAGIDILTRRRETILKNYFDKFRIIRGTVEDYNFISKLIKKYKIEFVFHLAATSLVGQALIKPMEAFSTNIRGTWNILEALRKHRTVKGIIIASSDKAYGKHNNLPYREDTSLCGVHPYDVSKSCADLLAYTYFNTYNLPVCITRCGNIFGPGDFNFSRIIPDAIRCALMDRILLIRSDGKFVRDYIYVDDIINGYLLLAQNLKKRNLYGEAFNFSDENPMRVIEIVKKIYKLVGKKQNYKILNQAKFEIRYQYLNSSKARRILNWKPMITLDEGLKRTIAWYRKFLKR